jgi:RNA polymerase sigma factor (sigma-70 family)
MYWNGAKDGLSRAELEAARLGFLGCLRRKRFSPQFISRHADDLFAQACLEYSRKLVEGVEIENPPGWLIECAWRRTKSQLEAERSAPRVVSTERSGSLAEEPGHDPEDVLLDADRFRKVREAVAELSVNQRRVLALSYFEGFTVREAARRLRWHPSKAQRAHERARERLHELLGVESSDDLVLEIGLAAYLSLAAQPSSGALQRVAEGLASVKQQILDGGAQLKQQTVAGYYRAVDPTPLAAARPGTLAAVVASCVAIGGGAATYCVERGVSPIGAARGLIASAEEPESSPPNPSDPAPQRSYTPAEPPGSEEAPAPESTPPAEQAPKPEPEKSPPVEDSYEPTRPAYMAASKAESAENTEAAEAAPVENPQPAPVPRGAGPQFGGP